MTDPIADMLNRIRNAVSTSAETTEMPLSGMKHTLARILKREGFIRDFSTEGRGVKKVLRVYLKYGSQREPVLRGIKRISRPGLRSYVKAGEMRTVKNGTGVAIVSTSRGVLTDREVRKYRVGGEWICNVW